MLIHKTNYVFNNVLMVLSETILIKYVFLDVQADPLVILTLQLVFQFVRNLYLEILLIINV